jgi:DNA-directed RNA polymerase specialized sigma24 family protein
MIQTLLSIPTNGTESGKRAPASPPRASIDQILQYSRHLAPADRALIEGVYLRGMSAADVARAAGKEPGTMRKRLARAVGRMSSPAFRFVARHRADWPPQRAAIADAVFLRGLSQRSAAMALGLGIHRVRREIDRIRTLVEDESARRESSRANS